MSALLCLFRGPTPGTWFAAFAVLAALSAGCSEDPSAPEADRSDGGADGGGLPGPEAGPGRNDAGSHDAAAATDVDHSDALFRPDHLLEVALTLAPADFAQLRGEGRSMTRVLSGCELLSEYAYTKFHARLVVDGQSLADVALRKKGLLGSLSVPRPSLRVDIDEYVDDQELSSERTLTLNNSLQDRTYAHQCIAYALFEKAGIPSPRCNFAHVVVNGEDLGTYVHVEAIKKPFLKRRFGSDEGDLYEGSAGDFVLDRIAYLEKKTHEDEPRSPELSALLEALDLPDAQFMERLSQLLDLDEFMRFWATEVLVGEGDGYSSNQNNYFVYVHPVTRKLHFIPWGKDGALNPTNVVSGTSTQPVSVYAKGVLCKRLYAYAPTREQYRRTLQTLLDTVWNEQELELELTRIAALTHAEKNVAALASQRMFFGARRAALQAELDGEAPSWNGPGSVPIACYAERVRTVQGTFDLPMGTDAAPGFTLLTDSKLSVTLANGPVEPLITAGFGGTSEAGTAFGLAITELDGSQVQLLLISQRTDLAAGDLPFHGFETFGMLQSGPDAEHLTTEGFISDGVIHFDALTLGAGGVAKGHFEGQFVLTLP